MKPDPNVEWESGYLYNATAIVIDDKVFMLYRAQNKDKLSSVGIAWSEDGINFVKHKSRSSPLLNRMNKEVGVRIPDCKRSRVQIICGHLHLL